jgi:hypothetical protein
MESSYSVLWCSILGIRQGLTTPLCRKTSMLWKMEWNLEVRISGVFIGQIL